MLSYKQSYHLNSARLSPDLFQVELTRRAKRKLTSSGQDLFVEMQLLFGCMLRKKLIFSNTTPQGDFMEVTQNLYVGLQTFMNGEACGIGGKHTGKELLDIMIGTPRWLMIDYKNKQWSGEFGLVEKPISMSGVGLKWLKELISIIYKPIRKSIFNLKSTQ
jgi:hypothetical protein